MKGFRWRRRRRERKKVEVASRDRKFRFLTVAESKEELRVSLFNNACPDRPLDASQRREWVTWPAHDIQGVSRRASLVVTWRTTIRDLVWKS